MFRFKQFSVAHDRCAMKVGTDSVLLGAWADMAQTQHLLDIGTGTGLIALMLAQRSAQTVQIDAIDIAADAAEQARQNIARSPWANRIKVAHCALQHYAPSTRYDHIVSNPPFFRAALLSAQAMRNTARHDTDLSFEALLHHAARLLLPQGRLSVVLPHECRQLFAQLAAIEQLYICRQTDIAAYPNKVPKRVLLELRYSAQASKCQHDILYVYQHKDTKKYSTNYQQLTNEFYWQE